MRNIRNLKDPTEWTKWKHHIRFHFHIHFHFHFLLIIILLSLFDSARAELTKVSCSSGGSTTITCDCNNYDQPMVLPFLHGDVSLVEIRHCPDLVVEANCLGDTIGLRKVSFAQVGSLVLRQSALSVPRYASNKALIVEFEQTNIKLIESHAITGNIEEISFVGGRIDEMKPFGFTTTKNSAILLKLDGVTIRHIESQAFKKFAVEQMSISNCQFLGDLPTRAFYELEVLNELSLRGNHFHQEVHSHAFSFKLVSKLSLSENHFVAVDGEWLEAQIRDAVTLRGNDFGATSEIAFRSLTVHRSYQLSERLELRFHNNTLHSSRPGADPKAADEEEPGIQPQPLRFDERFALSIRELRYDNPWSCDQLDRNVEPPLPRAEFFRLHSDQLMFQPPGQQSQVTRAASAPAAPLVPLRLLITDQCREQSYTAYIVAGSVILGLLLLLLILVVWWRIVQRRRRRKLDVVQPEPRTYKETQIVYQIENAGLLKTDL